jgi:hypothetical protein
MATTAKTLQEKFGFMDSDINKPEHDEIINWIDDNIEDLVMMVFKWPTRPLGVSTTWEAVVNRTEDGGGQIGFADLVARISETRILFEAKTTIDSLGALFRQIRMYQEGYVYESPVYKMPFVVVCPDDKHTQKIREQRIYFIRYDPKMKFAMGGV